MLATEAFKQILDKIQSSNLNFQLQLSPFSAQIFLKKSLVKDRAGNILHPPTNLQAQSYDGSTRKSHDEDIEHIVAKNKKIQNELLILQRNYETVVNDFKKARHTIETLENQEIKPDVVSKSVIEEYTCEIRDLKQNNETLQSKIDESDDTVNELKNIIKNSREAADRINKELNDYKVKYSREKALQIKEHKAEIKVWRKDLGELKKENIKLKEKLSNKLDNQSVTASKVSSPATNENPHNQQPESEVVCSICANPILDYKPKYFLGEVFNPACNECDDSFDGDNSGPITSICKHTPQCVSRQPHPPPSPSMPYIFHDVSKYHLHMMTKSNEDLTGCVTCFSVDNENYGCDKCTWLKWWFKWHGDRHGLPDIHPSKYRKYL